MTTDDFKILDFTEKEYEKILEIAKTKYTFEWFGTQSKEKHVIWRHDVDFSMHRALRLAQIENQAGITATYFIMLRSEFYHIFERDVKDCILKIKALGHKVGLHFDISYYPEIKSASDLTAALNYEANILEQEYLIDIDCFSFHNTSELTKIFTDDYYGNFLNVYSNTIQNKYDYCSDSNGYWRFDRLSEVMERDDIQFLQVLTHPVWWLPEPMLPRDRVERAVYGRARKVLEIYDNVLKDGGRVNVRSS